MLLPIIQRLRLPKVPGTNLLKFALILANSRIRKQVALRNKSSLTGPGESPLTSKTKLRRDSGESVNVWLPLKMSENSANGTVTSFHHSVVPAYESDEMGQGPFVAEKDRYHLYVSMTCPFAHRALAVRALKGLEDVISVDVTASQGQNGWEFSNQLKDTVFGKTLLRDVYREVAPNYAGKITVPLLVDKKTKQIVNNESAEIAVIFNSAFNGLCATEQQSRLDLYPGHLKGKIDELNGWIGEKINSGVYKVTFAKTQEAYNAAVKDVFRAMDQIEVILSSSRYLTGPQLTLADIRLFTSLVRFDIVYYNLFKCNLRHVYEYPNMWGYVRELYQMAAFKRTTDFDLIKKGYYQSPNFGANGIVPLGPVLSFEDYHGRDRLRVITGLV